MADSLTRADAHPVRLVRSLAGTLELAGRSAPVVRLQDLVRRASTLSSGVLLVAERGADTSGVARDLHARGRHPAAPFVTVECGMDAEPLDRLLFGCAVPGGLLDLESVGSDSRLVHAGGGTLFLQDVGELSAALQTRLARILRDGEARIEGQPVAITCRFVASAPVEIESDARVQRFRADLYRRLSATRIDLLPLRERQPDIPELATRLVEHLCAARGLGRRTLTQAALALLTALPWPGNLREFQEVLDRAVVESRGDTIKVEQLLPAIRLPIGCPQTSFAPADSLRDARLRFEREYITAVLEHHGWRTAEAAETLGIKRPNLYRKARQLGIPLAKTSE
jgi:two-component system, NtrC family, response regulator HydG